MIWFWLCCKRVACCVDSFVALSLRCFKLWNARIQHHLWVSFKRVSEREERIIWTDAEGFTAMMDCNENWKYKHFAFNLGRFFSFAVLLSADLSSTSPNVNEDLSLVCVEKTCLYSIRSLNFYCLLKNYFPIYWKVRRNVPSLNTCLPSSSKTNSIP